MFFGVAGILDPQRHSDISKHQQSCFVLADVFGFRTIATNAAAALGVRQSRGGMSFVAKSSRKPVEPKTLEKNKQ